MDKEMKMIDKNKTWELVLRPNHKNIIRVKQIYKSKWNANRSISKLKVKLIAKCSAQEE